MRTLTRSSGVELARHNILGIGMAPGAVATPINPGTMNDAKLARPEAAIPVRRMARPAEIASVVGFPAGRVQAILLQPDLRGWRHHAEQRRSLALILANDRGPVRPDASRSVRAVGAGDCGFGAVRRGSLVDDRGSVRPDASRSVDPVGASNGLGLLAESERTGANQGSKNDPFQLAFHFDLRILNFSHPTGAGIARRQQATGNLLRQRRVLLRDSAAASRTAAPTTADAADAAITARRAAASVVSSSKASVSMNRLIVNPMPVKIAVP
jgi:hypothetical protein